MTNRALRAAPDPDDFSDLYDELERSGPTRTNLGPWNPQAEGPGSDIKGHVVAVREIDTQYGKKAVLTIDTETGEREVRAFHTALRTALEKRPPAKDAKILIRYEGTGTTAKGYEFHKYSVVVGEALKVDAGRNWIDVFNGIATPDQPHPRTTKSKHPTARPVEANDLPF